MESASGTEARISLRTSGLLSLVLGLLLLQSALYVAFAADCVDVPAFLYLHLGLCGASAVFGCWWIWVSSSAEQARDKAAIVLQLVVWTTLAGPFGTLLAAALLLPRRAAASDLGRWREAQATAEKGSDLAHVELLHGSLLDRRLRVEHANSTRSLLDIVIDGTQVEKFDALSLIAKRYVPALAPALRRALEDKNGSVRVLAAKVMAQQHDAYTKRIGALQAKAATAPGGSAYWNELAQAHLDYAESGLLEQSRADAEAKHALAHLVRAEQSIPATP